MKIVGKIFLALLLIVVLGAGYVFGSMGYIPGLSKALGAAKPRDLGINYSEQDRISARAKSQLVYGVLPSSTPAEASLVRSGSRPVTDSWSSAEMTALLNNRPWLYWPVKDVQLKINNDGTAELSGILMKDKISGCAAAFGVPAQVANTMVKLLPPDPSFYIKAKASLENNQVGDFDVQSASIGKMPIPVDTLLANLTSDPVAPVMAADINSELSKYQGKRSAIISFINERLAKITGFYAKKANFENGQLNFDGTLSEQEMTAR